MSDDMTQQAMEQLRSRPEPQPDPHDPRPDAEALESNVATDYRRKAAGNPNIDGALRDLDRLAGDLSQTHEALEKRRGYVRTGELPEESFRELRRITLDRAQHQFNARSEAAKQAVEAERAELVAHFLPTSVQRGQATAEAKDDIKQALATYDDPADGIPELFQRAVRERDITAHHLLSSTWGHDLYLSSGGSEEAWKAMRKGFVAVLADFYIKEFPGGEDAKKARKLVDGNVDKALAANLARAHSKLLALGGGQ